MPDGKGGEKEELNARFGGKQDCPDTRGNSGEPSALGGRQPLRNPGEKGGRHLFGQLGASCGAQQKNGGRFTRHAPRQDGVRFSRYAPRKALISAPGLLGVGEVLAGNYAGTASPG